MRQPNTKLLTYSGFLLVIAAAQMVLVIKVGLGGAPVFGMVFLYAFVGFQLLSALAGIVLGVRGTKES